jgi:hypothetical protein
MTEARRLSTSGSLRVQLDKVAELVSLSSSLRLRVNNRSMSNPRLSGVFSPSPPLAPAAAPADDGAASKLAEENARLREQVEVLREDNRLLTEDFEDAVSVVRQISEAHRSELAGHQGEGALLAEIAKLRAENEQLKLKLYGLLAQVSRIAYVDE